MKDAEAAQEIWRDFHILDEIARDASLSQRDLSERAGMALGRTNQVIKRLVRKGLVKTSQINAKRVAYYLTPKGFAEKLRLVVRYAQITVNLFSNVRQVINNRLEELIRDQGIRTVILVGPGELGEAAYLSIQEFGLELVAVFDHPGHGGPWLGRQVLTLGQASTPHADVVMVTDLGDSTSQQAAIETLGRTVIEVRELLSEQLAAFAARIAEDDPRRSVNREEDADRP